MRLTSATFALTSLALLFSWSSGDSAPFGNEARKNKVAALFYGEPLERPVLVEDRVKVGVTGVVLGQVRGREVPLESVSRRPCLRVALFSKTDWEEYGRLPVMNLKPEMASDRYWYFPAHEGAPPLTYRVDSGELIELPFEVAAEFEEYEVLPSALAELGSAMCVLDTADQNAIGGR